MQEMTANSWRSRRALSGDIEWASAFFRGLAFSPHRHDTYAVGFTTAGVQSFKYRGEERRACSGDVFILHPDELHDGREGTDAGYGYRIAYLAPDLISNALGEKALPFIAEAITRDRRMAQSVGNIFPDLDEIDDDLYRTGAVTELADTLNQLAGWSGMTIARADFPAVRRIRDHLMDIAPASITIADLERVHGIDRYSLSRQFRMAFGVSPHRFIILRRLDLARDLIRQGCSLANAAVDAGFADQSHMTRHFRKAFGLSPGAWRSLLHN
jgi:AraC-like DNA-binding protein